MQLFSCSHTHTHTHTNHHHHHHHHQHDFMCLLNFQVLEAHIVLSECIISRLIPTDFQYSMNPPSSVHICKRDTEKCINLQFKRPSLNSDFLIAQTLCGQTIRIKLPLKTQITIQLHTETHRGRRATMKPF